MPILVDGQSAIEAFGLVNPKGPDGVPHPATAIIAPDGTLIHFEVFPEYMKREKINDMLAAVEAHRGTGRSQVAQVVDTKKGELPTIDFAWPETVDVSPGREINFLVSTELPEGAHIYGRLETSAMATRITMAETPGFTLIATDIPDGVEKGLDIGKSFVLSGSPSLGLTLGLSDKLKHGDYGVDLAIDYQVCTDTACSTPRRDEHQLRVRLLDE